MKTELYYHSSKNKAYTSIHKKNRVKIWLFAYIDWQFFCHFLNENITETYQLMVNSKLCYMMVSWLLSKLEPMYVLRDIKEYKLVKCSSPFFNVYENFNYLF